MPTEKEWAAGKPALLSPQERAEDEARNQRPANLKALKEAIAQAKDPKIRGELLHEQRRIESGSPVVAKPNFAFPQSDDEFFEVEGTGTTPQGRVAKINGIWMPVDQTGTSAAGKKVARFGSKTESALTMLREGFASGKGLSTELGEGIAVARGGPGAAEALAAGERHELGQRFPTVANTPRERSMPATVGRVAGSLTDPTTLLGMRSGPVTSMVIGGGAGAAGEVASELKSGRPVSPAHVGLSGIEGAGLAGVLGFAHRLLTDPTFTNGIPRTGKYAGMSDKDILQARLNETNPTGVQREQVITDEQADALVAEITRRAEKHGAPAKPIKEKKGKEPKIAVKEGEITGDPNEASLDDVLPGVSTPLDTAIREIEALTAKHKHEPMIRNYFEASIPDHDRGKARIVDKYFSELSQQTQDFLAQRNAKDWETGESIPGYDSIRGTHIFDLYEEQFQRGLARHEPKLGDLPEPPKPEFPDVFKGKEGGSVSPVLASRVAGGVAGGAAGAAADENNRTEGAIYGAAGGFLGAGVVARKFITGGYGSALRVAGTNPGKDLIDQMEARKAAWYRSATATSEQLEGLEKEVDPKRFRAVIDALEKGDLSTLSPQEQQLAVVFKTAIAHIGTEAQNVGLVEKLRQNYVPMQFDWNDKTTAKTLEKLGYQKPSMTDERRVGFSTYTPHQMERTIDTYATAEKLGLKSKTMTPSELFANYANSVTRAVENKRAIEELKQLKDSNGTPLVVPRGTKGTEGWKDFRDIRSMHVPELDGMVVHPDIKDSVALGMSSHDPGVIARAAMATSFTTKRLATAASGFHATNLLFGYMGANGPQGIPKALDYLAGAGASGVNKITSGLVPKLWTSGVDKRLADYKAGGAGDVSDFLIRNGLQVKTGPLEETQGRGLIHDLGEQAANHFDSTVGKGLVKTPWKLDDAFQKFTFDYTQTGMKLDIAATKFEQEVVRNAKAHAAGKEPLKDLNKIAEDASSFANSITGGIDWRRSAEDVQNHFFKKAAMSAVTPEGKQWMQLGAFAPDWAVSTLQPWMRGLGLSANSPDLERYSQQYLFWSALHTAVISDAINMKMSGHHIWENNFPNRHYGEKEGIATHLSDMTAIDMGDGRYIDVNKHFSEGIHLAADPLKFAAGKLSVPVSAAVSVASGQQWPGGPPMHKRGAETDEKAKDWAMWLSNKFAPISVQQFMKGGAEGTLGAIGLPVHGKKQGQADWTKD